MQNAETRLPAQRVTTQMKKKMKPRWVWFLGFSLLNLASWAILVVTKVLQQQCFCLLHHTIPKSKITEIRKIRGLGAEKQFIPATSQQDSYHNLVYKFEWIQIDSRGLPCFYDVYEFFPTSNCSTCYPDCSTHCPDCLNWLNLMLNHGKLPRILCQRVIFAQA